MARRRVRPKPKRRNPLEALGGMTRAQAARERKRLLGEIESQVEAEYRARLAALAERERTAKVKRSEALAAARAACRTRYRAELERARAQFWERVELAREVRDHETATASRACANERTHIRSKANAEIAAARAARREEHRQRRETRRAERWAERRTAQKVTRAERRGESDDAVLANIDDNLVPLWERVKSKMRATDRMSRTEAFLRYAEENPHEVLDAQMAEADRQLARDLARRRGRERSRQRAELDEVPF